MGFLTRPASRYSSDDEGEDDGGISLMVSTLRCAFRTEDFDRVEKELVEREAKLKRENKKLRREKAVLEEKHQFEQLEKLKAEEDGNAANERYERLLEEVKKGARFEGKDAFFELRRKNDKLESEKKKLVAFFARESASWGECITRLEEKVEKLMSVRGKGARRMKDGRVNGEVVNDCRPEIHSIVPFPVVDLENGFECNGCGSMEASRIGSPLSERSHSKANGDQKTSGALLIIDSDDDFSPEDTMRNNKTSEKPKGIEYSGLTSVQKNPMVLKRKRASSLSASDSENGGDKFEQEFTPIRIRKPHSKSSLEPSGSLANHCSEAAVASPFTDPVSCEAEEKSPDIYRSPVEASDNCDSSDSSISSSSSSDSEDGERRQFLFSDAIQKMKKGSSRS